MKSMPGLPRCSPIKKRVTSGAQVGAAASQRCLKHRHGDCVQKEEDLLESVQKPWHGPTASSEATGEQAGERLRPQHAQRATVSYYDPLATPLPRAPGLRVYCGYGHGIATERAYHYRHSPVLCDSQQCPAGMLETDLSNSQARCRPMGRPPSSAPPPLARPTDAIRWSWCSRLRPLRCDGPCHVISVRLCMAV